MARLYGGSVAWSLFFLSLRRSTPPTPAFRTGAINNPVLDSRPRYRCPATDAREAHQAGSAVADEGALKEEVPESIYVMF